MDVATKLAILADAAKHDVACASSGGASRRGVGGMGANERRGVCHGFTPDGRCVSLLKILLTNVCVFDCRYCVSRRSRDTRRARFTIDEVVALTIAFHKRNYVEGLFLSSGVLRNPDYTMEQLIAVGRKLRDEEGFRGYLHLKAVPGACHDLLIEAGRLADRLSINIELPTAASLSQWAPEKSMARIESAMACLRRGIEEGGTGEGAPFSPAGQSTQMIVGADDASDATLLTTAQRLYAAHRLRRVYYSAYHPPAANAGAPPGPPLPLAREHRLYQSDWLVRFYGFRVEEIVGEGAAGMLDLDIDPKLAWALRHREHFPVDVNTEERGRLLRVPGLGRRGVERLLAARRHHAIRIADLARLGVPLRKIKPFVITADYRPPTGLTDGAALRARLAPRARQLSLFAADA